MPSTCRSSRFRCKGRTDSFQLGLGIHSGWGCDSFQFTQETTSVGLGIHSSWDWDSFQFASGFRSNPAVCRHSRLQKRGLSAISGFEDKRRKRTDRAKIQCICTGKRRFEGHLQGSQQAVERENRNCRPNSKFMMNLKNNWKNWNVGRFGVGEGRSQLPTTRQKSFFRLL